MEQTLKFLGSDSGFGNKNNSAYFINENEFLLFDCGFTVFEQIKEKFDLNKFDKISIIITHLHNDHAGSLSQVIMYLWYVYHKKVTVVSLCENIKTYLKITGTPEESYEIVNELNNLKFIQTEHVVQLDSYGFIVNLNGKNIIYTSDTKSLDSFVPYFNDADEIYIDISKNGGVHLKIDDVLNDLINLTLKR